MAGTEALWKQVFGDCGGFWDTFFQVAWDPEHCLFLEEQGQLQAALYWFDCHCGGSWAYIFAVATAPAHRGKGLCRRLMEKAHAHLASQGYQGALLVPAEAGLRRMYGKMGYREATALREFSCTAEEPPLPLSELNSAAYAAARKQLLPHSSVLQEDAALSLLEATGVRFFAGEDCLLAAEGSHLLEFLGDPQKLPGILTTLGCPKAKVRTPGTETPFAMAIPFQEGAALPQYFAFAFD